MTMMNSTSYPVMWGRHEPLVCARPGDHHASGLLDASDRTAELGSSDVPTLITVGRYGMAPRRCAETIRDGIPGAAVVVFEHSGHYPMLEKSERFLRVVGSFLDEHA